MRLWPRSLVLALPFLLGCASQTIARRVPASAPTLADALKIETPADLQSFLKRAELEDGWRFMIGRESTEFSFSGFLGLKVTSQRIVAPNVLGVRFFDRDLMFAIPTIVPFDGKVREGVTTFSLTPPGDRLAYVLVRYNEEEGFPFLYVWDSAEKEPRFVKQLPNNFLNGQLSPIALSPDGTRLAMIVPDETGTALHLTVLSLADKSERVIACDVWSDLNWTADGRSIIFVSNTLVGDKKVHIDMVNVDSGERRLLTEGFGPSISPDGKRLAFVRAYRKGFLSALVMSPPTPMYDILVRDMASGTEDTLIRHNRVAWGRGQLVTNHRTVWSPDSRFLHYAWMSTLGVGSGFVVDTESRVALDLGQQVGFAGWNRLSDKFEAHMQHDHALNDSAHALWKAAETARKTTVTKEKGKN